jgi:hypothetical protein
VDEKRGRKKILTTPEEGQELSFLVTSLKWVPAETDFIFL